MLSCGLTRPSSPPCCRSTGSAKSAACARVVARPSARQHVAVQLAGMGRAVAGGAEAAHRVSDHEHRQVGELRAGLFDEQIGIGYDLRAVVVPHLLAHGAPVPAMIEAHDGVPGFQQPLRHVVVASEVLAQPVDDDDCRLRPLRCVDAPDQQEALGGLFRELLLHARSLLSGR